jgi:hypothetical protein
MGFTALDVLCLLPLALTACGAIVGALLWARWNAKLHVAALHEFATRVGVRRAADQPERLPLDIWPWFTGASIEFTHRERNVALSLTQMPDSTVDGGSDTIRLEISLGVARDVRLRAYVWSRPPMRLSWGAAAKARRIGDGSWALAGDDDLCSRVATPELVAALENLSDCIVRVALSRTPPPTLLARAWIYLCGSRPLPRVALSVGRGRFVLKWVRGGRPPESRHLLDLYSACLPVCRAIESAASEDVASGGRDSARPQRGGLTQLQAGGG